MLGIRCPDRHALPPFTSSKTFPPRRALPPARAGSFFGATSSLLDALGKVPSQSDLQALVIVRCRPAVWAGSGPRGPFSHRQEPETRGERGTTRSGTQGCRQIAPEIRPALVQDLADGDEMGSFRPSTDAKPNRSALHSVCIGTPSGPEINRFANSIFSDPGPRCT